LRHLRRVPVAFRQDDFLHARAGMNPPVTRSGVVYLVGAGPGDPGLLTIRAAELLARADVVFHDYLVSEAVLARCHEGARLVDVGKVGHGPQCAQSAIETRLIEAARSGLSVVRLKGGDPLLFGRGAEEALALFAAGIPFEIVPGVSSAFAAPAYAGIPLTARGIAKSVSFATGHSCSGEPAAIPVADTIVVLMGVSNVAAVRRDLVAAGVSPETPAAAVQWGTCAAQRVVCGTLADLPERIAAAGLGAPAVVVIGEVVRLRERLRWVDEAGDATAAGKTEVSDALTIATFM
jgi:uroporphyrin-III C-methyltransferase